MLESRPHGERLANTKESSWGALSGLWHWDGYQHQFAGNATQANRDVSGVDFNSDLMRLAAGGSA